MTTLDAIILGIVEGLTEFLPVSSTGHLLMAGRLLGLAQTEFLKTFDLAVQLGAIAAVVLVEWRTLLHGRKVLPKVAAAFLPTGIIGFALYKVIKGTLLANDAVVPWALITGGVALIAFERWHGTREAAPAQEGEPLERISYRQAVIIGTAQSLAMIPGVSRSAATVVAALAQGISRETAVRFSFLLAIPTMLAATAYDLLKSAPTFAASDLPNLAVGMLVSFAVALAAVRFLLRYVRTRTFVAFGVYRIVAALAFWAVIGTAVAAPQPVLTSAAPNAAPSVAPAAPVAALQLEATPDASSRVTLLAVGDVMLSRDVGTGIRRRKDVHWPYAALKESLGAADIAFANLETAITPGLPVPTNSMSFRADVDTAAGLAAAGFDVVSLANNHSPNYGQEGLQDTFAALRDAGIAFAGAGADAAAARAPAVVEREGYTFAFLAYNDGRIVPGSYQAGDAHAGTAYMDADRMTEDVVAAAEKYDVVIVSMHAGNEYVAEPVPRQQNFARAAIDAGADAVIGHHPHVVQTFERYKGKPIFYSLGNFVFDQMWSSQTRDGAVAVLTFDDGELSMVDAFATTIYDYGQPRLAGEDAATRILARLGPSDVALPLWHWDLRPAAPNND